MLAHLGQAPPGRHASVPSYAGRGPWTFADESGMGQGPGGRGGPGAAYRPGPWTFYDDTDMGQFLQPGGRGAFRSSYTGTGPWVFAAESGMGQKPPGPGGGGGGGLVKGGAFSRAFGPSSYPARSPWTFYDMGAVSTRTVRPPTTTPATTTTTTRRAAGPSPDTATNGEEQSAWVLILVMLAAMHRRGGR